MQQFLSEDILVSKDVLGRGAYGVVLQGFHKIHGNVAVKCAIIKGGHKMEGKIKHEMDNLRRSSHENVVRILGWTIFMKTIAIVMEHLPGGNLIEVLQDDEVTLAPLLRLRHCAEIARGIAFIHNLPGKRLVHGDIKPENILFTADLHCKIADFGESKLSNYTGANTEISEQSRHNKYTEIYAAPELLQNSLGNRVPAHDTYSFSMTVYVVLNRKLPILSDRELPMYLEGIKAEQRPATDSLDSWRLKLEREQKLADANIVNVLIQVMQSCWDHNPKARPGMLKVKEKLYSLLNKFHPSEMLKCVAESTKNMEFSKVPCHDQLVPLDQLVWPRQQEPSAVATSFSVESLTETIDLSEDEEASLQRNASNPTETTTVYEKAAEEEQMEVNAPPSLSKQTADLASSNDSKSSNSYKEIDCLRNNNSSIVNQIQTSVTSRQHDVAAESQLQTNATSPGFSIRSTLSRFLPFRFPKDESRLRSLASSFLGSSVDAPAIQSASPQTPNLSFEPSPSTSASCSEDEEFVLSASNFDKTITKDGQFSQKLQGNVTSSTCESHHGDMGNGVDSSSNEAQFKVAISASSESNNNNNKVESNCSAQSNQDVTSSLATSSHQSSINSSSIAGKNLQKNDAEQEASSTNSSGDYQKPASGHEHTDAEKEEVSIQTTERMNIENEQQNEASATSRKNLHLDTVELKLRQNTDVSPTQQEETSLSATRPKDLFLDPMSEHLKMFGIVCNENVSPGVESLSSQPSYLLSPNSNLDNCDESSAQGTSQSTRVDSTPVRSPSPVISPLRKGSVANSLLQSLMCSVGAPTPQVATSYAVSSTGDLEAADSLSLEALPASHKLTKRTYFDLKKEDQDRFKDDERSIIEKLEEIKSLIELNDVKEAKLKVNKLIATTVQTTTERCEVIVNSVLRICRMLEDYSEYVLIVRLIDWSAVVIDYVNNPSAKLDLLENCCDAVHNITESMHESGDLENIRRFSLAFFGKLHKHKIIPLKMYNLNRKTIVETSCLLYVGYCYYYLKKYKEADEISQASIVAMATRFGDKAAENQLFAHSYNLRAYANFYMNNQILAIELYKKAIELFMSAKDLNQMYRQEMIDAVKKFLQDLPFSARLIAFSRRLVAKPLLQQ